MSDSSDQLSFNFDQQVGFNDPREECMLQIRCFTGWCSKHGYKVVGGMFMSHHQDDPNASMKLAIEMLELILHTMKGQDKAARMVGTTTMSILDN
jgi:hypothetical protein